MTLNNVNAEKIFLQLLLDNYNYLELVNINYFSTQETQDVFVAIQEIFIDNLIPNKALLEEKGIFADWLFEPAKGNIETYYEIIKSLYIKREFSGYATKLKANIANKPVDQLILENQELLLKLTSNAIRDDKNIFINAMEHARESFVTRNLKGLAGISLINTDINDLTGGLRKKQLSVLAARPSIGKTLYAVNILSNHGLIDSVPALLISLEMPKEVVGERIIASELDINFHALNTGYLSKVDLEKIYKPISCADCSSEKITYKINYEEYASTATCLNCGGQNIITAISKLQSKNGNILIDDRPNLSITQILLTIKSYKIRFPELDLVVIDHLGEIGWAPGDKKVDKIGNICKMLRKISRELDIHVMLISQLNRMSEVEERQPALHDLRDSGEIEQIADIVIILHRDKKANQDQMLVSIEKQRNGPLGSTNALLNIKTQKFFKDSIMI